MMRKAVILITLLMFTFGCVLIPTESPVPILEEDCQKPITDDEVASMLDYQHDLFNNTDWTRSYSVAEDQAYVTYISDSMSAVVNINILRLCAAKVALEGYASPKTIDTIMEAYIDVVLEDSCRQGDTLLFQHSATSQGSIYQSNLWFTTMESPNRALKVMIVFPSGDASNMTSFSQVFFPDFISCSGAN